MIKTDIVIVGAGLIGSSVAMHLSKTTKSKITCIDVDLKGTFSSSELNAGGVRATWYHPLNSVLSKYSIDYFEKVADKVGFRQNGYMWMYDQTKWSLAKDALSKNQETNNLNIEFLNQKQIKEKYSFLDQVDDLGGATFSPKDGLLNPNLLKLHYREMALHNSKNIEFVDRTYVQDITVIGEDRISLTCYKNNIEATEEEIQNTLLNDSNKLHSNFEIETKILINCAGAWAKKISNLYDGFCPSVPVKRQVSLFECKGVDFTKYGMFVDSSGVYFHPEANYILSGFAIESESPGYNMTYDHSFFETEIWPKLYKRSSYFENIREITGWAGLYEVSPDHSAIIGKDFNKHNIYEAHSFSGRGVMQSYVAGLALSELIQHGSYKTHDLSAFSSQRFIKNDKLILESLVI